MLAHMSSTLEKNWKIVVASSLHDTILDLKPKLWDDKSWCIQCWFNSRCNIMPAIMKKCGIPVRAHRQCWQFVDEVVGNVWNEQRRRKTCQVTEELQLGFNVWVSECCEYTGRLCNQSNVAQESSGRALRCQELASRHHLGCLKGKAAFGHWLHCGCFRRNKAAFEAASSAWAWRQTSPVRCSNASHAGGTMHTVKRALVIALSIASLISENLYTNKRNPQNTS